jgi:hypothetical protein
VVGFEVMVSDRACALQTDKRENQSLFIIEWASSWLCRSWNSQRVRSYCQSYLWRRTDSFTIVCTRWWHPSESRRLHQIMALSYQKVS